MRPSRRLFRSRRLGLGALAAVAVLAVGGWYVFLRDAATPVSVGEAVTSFRAEGSAAGAEAPNEPAAVPKRGVYVYATGGFEAIDALIGSRHDYPDRTTITVRRGGCGLLMRWDALDGRSTTYDYCPSPDRWLIRSFSEIHQFFGQTDRRTYRCEEGSVALPLETAAPGTTWTSRCSTGATTETQQGEVIGIETLTVGGIAVETIRVRVQRRLSGETNGTGLTESWFLRSNGLLVREVVTNDNATPAAIGEVRYRERYVLELTSLDPRR